MRKIIIAVLVLIVALIGFVVFALFSLNTLVNNNKDYILTEAEKTLGRDVAVEEFEVNPWDVGVRLNGLSVADDPAFSQEPFVRAPSLQINLKLLPLLRKEFQIEKLILRQPVIRLIKNENGQFNFESLGGSEKPDKPAEQKKKEGQGLPIAASLINIDDGEVIYDDKKSDSRLKVDKLDFDVENLGFDEAVSINLAAAIFAEKQNFKIAGQAGPLNSASGFSDVPLKGKIEIAQLNIAELKKSVPVIVEILPETLSINGSLSLSANIEGTPENPVITESTLEATQSEISLGDNFNKPKGIPFVISTDAMVTENAIGLENTKIKLQTLELTGGGKIGLGETPSLNLTIASNQADLSVLKEILPALSGYELSGKLKTDAKIQGGLGDGNVPEINGTLTLAGVTAQPPQIPKPIRDLNAKIYFTGQQAKVEKTTFFLGDSKIRLAAQVQNFSPFTLTYNLSSPKLRLSDLMKTNSADKSPGALRNVKSEGQMGNENGSLSYNGTLSSAQGVISGIDFKNLQTAVSLADNVLTVNSLKLQALDGTISGNGRYGFAETAHRFTSDLQIQNLKLKELLTSMDSAYAGRIRGKTNLDINVSGRGDKWENIKSTLEGQGKAEVVNGAVLDINIAEQALSGITGLPGLTGFISPRIRNKYPEIFATRDTKFDKFEIPFTLGDGKIQTDDLLISANDYTITGEGLIDFDKGVDLDSVLTLSDKLSKDITQDVEAAKFIVNPKGRLEIPFILSGTLPEVKPKPDLSYLTQLIERAAIRKGTEKLKERVFDKILPRNKETSGKKPASPDRSKKGERGLEEKLDKGLQEILE